MSIRRRLALRRSVPVAIPAVLVPSATAATSGLDDLDGGQFNVNCFWFDKRGAFDPIVAPGQPPPASHMHDFFGNHDIAYDSTTTSLQAATGTSCDHAPTGRRPGPR